jgi:signal transduction histidine kinase
MSSEHVNWQPISRLPLVAGMIDAAVSDTAEHMQTLTKARARPHVLDDATIDRIERVHGEQLEFVDIYAEQLRRWQAEPLSPAQRREMDRLDAQNRRLRQLTRDVLALAQELRKGTIERLMASSDVELGLQALLRALPPGRS